MQRRISRLMLHGNLNIQAYQDASLLTTSLLIGQTCLQHGKKTLWCCYSFCDIGEYCTILHLFTALNHVIRRFWFSWLLIQTESTSFWVSWCGCFIGTQVRLLCSQPTKKYCTKMEMKFAGCSLCWKNVPNKLEVDILSNIFWAELL